MTHETETTTDAPDQFLFRFHGFTLDFNARPQVMSVLNLTPDSFSDGGKFFNNNQIEIDRAIEAAMQMVQEGADIIDVGGESTKPGAMPVSIEEEMRRVVPFIKELAKKISVPISIDTTKSAVAEAALKAGASIVNDISGFRFDKALPDVCARFGAPVILMHLRQKPSEMAWSFHDKTPYDNLIEDVKRQLQGSINIAAAFGITQVAVDVGFGFGKTVEGNYELLRRLREFKSLGKPILAGLSRKSFIGKVVAKHGDVAPVGERLFGSIAANTIALMNGANILRVHDTKAAADAVKIFQATLAPQAATDAR